MMVDLICAAFWILTLGCQIAIYQTLGKGVVWSLNLAIAFLINKSSEGGSGFSEGLLVGS